MSDFHGRLRTAEDLLKATGLFADTKTDMPGLEPEKQCLV